MHFIAQRHPFHFDLDETVCRHISDILQCRYAHDNYAGVRFFCTIGSSIPLFPSRDLCRFMLGRFRGFQAPSHLLLHLIFSHPINQIISKQQKGNGGRIRQPTHTRTHSSTRTRASSTGSSGDRANETKRNSDAREKNSASKKPSAAPRQLRVRSAQAKGKNNRNAFSSLFVLANKYFVGFYVSEPLFPMQIASDSSSLSAKWIDRDERKEKFDAIETNAQMHCSTHCIAIEK